LLNILIKLGVDRKVVRFLKLCLKDTNNQTCPWNSLGLSLHNILKGMMTIFSSLFRTVTIVHIIYITHQLSHNCIQLCLSGFMDANMRVKEMACGTRTETQRANSHHFLLIIHYEPANCNLTLMWFISIIGRKNRNYGRKCFLWTLLIETEIPTTLTVYATFLSSTWKYCSIFWSDFCEHY
jgi:hypothetical protein